MKQRLVNIIIITLVFILLLVVFSGMFSTTFALFATTTGAYKNYGETTGSGDTTHAATFDTFFSGLDGIVASQDTRCIAQVSLPSDFSGKEILFTQSGGKTIVTTADTGAVSQGGTGALARTYSIQPCAVYGQPAVKNFLANVNDPKGTYRQPEFQLYPTMAITADDTIMLGSDKETMNDLYLYKPDKDHICFLPNSEPFLGGSCSPDRDILRTDCFDAITKAYPDCRAGTSAAGGGNGGGAGGTGTGGSGGTGGGGGSGGTGGGTGGGEIIGASCDLANRGTVGSIPALVAKLKEMDIPALGDESAYQVIATMPPYGGFPAGEWLIPLMYVESKGDPCAVSPTKAYGLMQFTKTSAYGVGTVSYDSASGSWSGKVCSDSSCTVDNRGEPLNSILGAYKLIQQKYPTIASAAAGHATQENLRLFTIAAYNAGEGVIGNAIRNTLSSGLQLTWPNVLASINPADITYTSDKQGKINEVNLEVTRYESALAAYEASQGGIIT